MNSIQNFTLIVTVKKKKKSIAVMLLRKTMNQTCEIRTSCCVLE